ncbi:hypothetical protein BO79DRAFT_40322 [Aspergillus costaricaensis CBS 115574]|uniref:Uncharacterized protein n=1 Tax=Aspergillus costaricaensis CBS 115574 TaxID=1448317 RepID=A0ACD1I8A4_9EURO|nr:hypothetical protein BO79DRAFT_40322 [Aspergillus costaricaensis CBS 115574]RAK85998.1 hypothetical protein BO79DRAFT_40322 [Aspergillus costaricaensis CBS 115574]
MMYRSLLLESVLPYETRLTIRPSSTLEPHIPSTAYRSPTSVLRYFYPGRVIAAKSSTFFTLRGSSLRSTQEEENKPGGTPSHRQLFTNPVGSVVKVPKSLAPGSWNRIGSTYSDLSPLPTKRRTIYRSQYDLDSSLPLPPPLLYPLDVDVNTTATAAAALHTRGRGVFLTQPGNTHRIHP